MNETFTLHRIQSNLHISWITVRINLTFIQTLQKIMKYFLHYIHFVLKIYSIRRNFTCRSKSIELCLHRPKSKSWFSQQCCLSAFYLSPLFLGSLIPGCLFNLFLILKLCWSLQCWTEQVLVLSSCFLLNGTWHNLKVYIYSCKHD